MRFVVISMRGYCHSGAAILCVDVHTGEQAAT
jgi:hypothetical protein